MDSSAEREAAVSRIREFTRFYMPMFGLLDNHYLGSEYSAAEVRVLFELYTHDGCNAAHIARTINLDKSYLSRIIRGLEKDGYLTRTPSRTDSRSFELHLTEPGAALAGELSQRSSQQVGGIIGPLEPDACRALIGAFDTITDILKTRGRQDSRRRGARTMKIVPYAPKYKQAFIELNRLWITQMFTMEPEDIAVLEGIDQSLAQGGQVFLAVDGEDEVLAGCMIAPLPSGEWEIEKFCAQGMYTGTGAGTACLKACLDYARERRVEKIVIVSNRKCVQALHLYRKFGFVEVPVDREKFPYERADIAFEQVLRYE